MLKNKKIQVIQFILDPRFGGPHVYIKTYTEELSKKIDSKVVTPGFGKITDIKMFNLRLIHKWLYIFEILLNFIFIIFKFSKNKNTIFHVHGVDNIAPILSSVFLCSPLIWQIHEETTNSKLFLYFSKLIAKLKNAKIICVSKSSATKLRFRHALIIAPAVDCNFWNGIKDNSIARTGILNVAVVANISVVKGIDLLLEAVEKLNLRINIFIAGAFLSSQIKYNKKLLDRVREIEKLGFVKVNFLGQMNNYEIRSLLNKVDLFILPSRSEASPVSILEANFRLPIISSRVGSIPEMLDGIQVFSVNQKT